MIITYEEAHRYCCKIGLDDFINKHGIGIDGLGDAIEVLETLRTDTIGNGCFAFQVILSKLDHSDLNDFFDFIAASVGGVHATDYNRRAYLAAKARYPQYQYRAEETLAVMAYYGIYLANSMLPDRALWGQYIDWLVDRVKDRDFRAWCGGVVVTALQKVSIEAQIARYHRVDPPQPVIGTNGAVALLCHYESGGSIWLCIEPDGHTHS